MKSIYIKNLRDLKKISSEMYNKVISVQNNTIRVRKTTKGKKNLYKNMGEEKYISVHSQYDPTLQGKVISESVLEENKDIIMIFGMGLGYEVKEIIKKSPQKMYIIIEPDIEIFKTMLQNVDFKSIFTGLETVEIILENNAEKIRSIFEVIVKNNRTISISLVALPFYKYAYGELFKKTFSLIKESLRTIKLNILTNLSTDRQWILNYARNIKYLSETRPVEVIEEKLKNIPAVIVGAGPSVELNIEHLKKIKSQAIIVGAGNGARVLEKNNIKADIIGAIDGNAVSEKIYRDIELNRDTTLFYSSQIYNSIPGIFSGKKFLMNQMPMDAYINSSYTGEMANCVSGPSITNVLAYNLSKLGCNPIIFLGQDLCGQNNISYSKDTIYNEGKNTVPQLPIRVINKKGEECYSNNAFLTMKYSMESIIKEFPGIKYLNGTENGLHIDGAQDIDFNKYTDEIILNEDDNKIEYELESAFLEKTYNKDNSSIKFIENLYRDIQGIREKITEVLALIETNESDIEKQKKVNKLEKELNNINLYKNVIDKMFRCELEVIFSSKKCIEREKNIYMYYLEKCNIMIEGLNSIKDNYNK